MHLIDPLDFFLCHVAELGGINHQLLTPCIRSLLCLDKKLHRLVLRMSSREDVLDCTSEFVVVLLLSLFVR